MLLASEQWARERELPVLAYITVARARPWTMGQREGLLMAPVHGMPRMLERAGLRLAGFDYFEIHEAFAAQVLCTLAAWEDPVFCKHGSASSSRSGAIDRTG